MQQRDNFDVWAIRNINESKYLESLRSLDDILNWRISGDITRTIIPKDRYIRLPNREKHFNRINKPRTINKFINI